VTIVNIENGASVDVLINDYGPKAYTGRVIDLSLKAFSQIADPKRGIINVVVML